jgi:phage baseplate assembly protein W
MAQIIQSKVPIDLVPSKAIGFGFPLNGDAVFVPTYQTRDQIKANMVNYLLTNKGERVFNPNFGGDLRNLLFDQIEDAELDDLKTMIQEDIATFFPLVEIKEISFDNTSHDENSIQFNLTYEVVVFGFEDELNILLQ